MSSLSKTARGYIQRSFMADSLRSTVCRRDYRILPRIDDSNAPLKSPLTTSQTRSFGLIDSSPVAHGHLPVPSNCVFLVALLHLIRCSKGLAVLLATAMCVISDHTLSKTNQEWYLLIYCCEYTESRVRRFPEPWTFRDRFDTFVLCIPKPTTISDWICPQRPAVRRRKGLQSVRKRTNDIWGWTLSAGIQSHECF
jgi:hypothetical protein